MAHAYCGFTTVNCRVCAQVLMRALRDFNLPKIVTSDVPIFLGLISDLFPQLDVPRKRDPGLEAAVRQSVTELHLQPEENFILKVPCFWKKKQKNTALSAPYFAMIQCTVNMISEGRCLCHCR